LLRGEDAFEIFHVIMSILEGLAEGKATAVNNAGVVPSVDDDHIVFADQGRYDSEVSLIPGSEEKGCLFLLGCEVSPR
jgi:hypothetical protein